MGIRNEMQRGGGDAGATGHTAQRWSTVALHVHG
eukprot:CAMPEP_0174291832 /NCGR_PEP_ID=MMETSP0809-20121228/33425_1 /TAXON_ID=73025 ORGANISM="Eutreptiella gymnastica-like, Strain CCMP1594" /NCGR_SAMPLE_ID=MMETSP0809 /ASSEMBLY_ACC=CAM_ASM_000658 /LENGTH=33 /DNA_ID= /DNA_START= /DNA_END= /DNA_ORIENTATION=